MMSNLEECSLRSALFTDLYELTMAQAYHREEMAQQAVFELFFRSLPSERNYIIAAGLEDVLSYLEGFHFTSDDLDYLRQQNLFSEDFLERLSRLKFTGDVYAVREGSVVFANEPVIQVIAPILEAQLVETFLLNQIHYQSLAASKAARVVTAAQGRAVVDFGSRRSHGTDAALKMARCSYLAGAAGTSNVLAGKLYGIPIYGTMAHSYIQSHESEAQAMEAFARIHPQTTLLIDTYDTIHGAEQVIALSHRLGKDFQVQAVRLDSGNLTELSKQVRELFDTAGLDSVKIFVSSGLNEHKVAEMVKADAPINGFGVGTDMAVVADAPQLDFAYKLVELNGKPRTKLSASKTLLPGRKQVYRHYSQGQLSSDHITGFEEKARGMPLLEKALSNGQRTGASHSLDAIQEFTGRQIAELPDRLRSLEPARPPYQVTVSEKLEETLMRLREEIGEGG